MPEANAIPVAVTDLEIGMYVTALDRPWIETPFLVEGFYVSSQADIDEVEKHCRFVYVDVYRSKIGPGARRNSRLVGTRGRLGEQVQIPREMPLERVSFRPRDPKVATGLFPQRKLKPYEDTATFAAELPLAKPAYAGVVGMYRQMMERFCANGKIEASGVREALVPLVDSMVRNPDACLWLARNRDEESYAWGHSVGAVVWAVALGRQLGLPRTELQRLAVGALLFDVGKLRIPEELLRKRERLTPGEFQLVKSHIDFGMEMLRDTGLLNRTVSDMIEYHHERHGGHGYPRGASGDDIPVFGRIAAIVDCYDAVTSRRPYAEAMSPSHAVKQLYAWRDVDFQAELVEEFIQAVGVYPAGTLVELSNAEVGVAMAGQRRRRLRPQVLLLLGRDGKAFAEPRLLDLAAVTQDEDGKPLEIATSLEPGAFGLKPETIVL